MEGGETVMRANSALLAAVVADGVVVLGGEEAAPS